MSPSQIATAPKRRSSRVDKAMMLVVQGVAASREPYREEVTTGSISCHGCTYQMRHEVRPGDIVVLNSARSEFPRRALVKWIKKLNTPNNPTYNVGVELEVAGNIWGIASPPADWFPLQSGKLVKPVTRGPELIVRTEPQKAMARSEAATAVPILNKNDVAASLAPWFAGLMSALRNQIQVSVCQIAAETLTNERKRLFDEFRVQIQIEAASTIEQVIGTSKDELARRGLKVLNEGAEAMVLRTVERLQHNLETSRTEATERFVSRLRERVAPVMEEAQTSLQGLVASQTVFKQESQAIHKRVTSQLESEANARLLQTHNQLEKNSTSVVNEANEKLLELSQTFEKIARDNTQAMIASATDDANKNLEQRAAEISTDFTDQLQGSARNFLELVVKSIADFPEKTPDPTTASSATETPTRPPREKVSSIAKP
jgi:hypothetical protein